MSVTDEIKSRLDIVAFLSQYIQLKKAGRNYTALCPFHGEKTPSFVVFPESQNWRCFGACGEGGDIFNFVMKLEGLDFAGALKSLADKAGVELEERSPDQLNQDQRLERLRGLLDVTANFFHEKLMKAPEAEHARVYARKRGLNDKTLTDFRIGFAPNDWRQSLDYLTALGYQEEEIVETGVAIRNEDKDSVYDRFRNRLIIPICDGRGQVIGFGGRILNPDDNPKYLNSPQSPVFDKGATLFGLHNARRTIREMETAVIVEGYMDAIQAHQAGFTNVVAQMGTAMTEQQLRQLSKYAKKLILALDADEAGVKATMRGLDVITKTLKADDRFNFDIMMQRASRLGVELFILTVTDGKDPDDFIRENPDGWRDLIAHAQPVVDYVIQMGTAQLTPQSTYIEREQIARELLPILMATESNLQQSYNIQRLALKLRIDAPTLTDWAQSQVRKLRKSDRPKLQTGEAAEGRTQPDQAESSDNKGEAKTADRAERSQVNAMERYCLSLLLRNSRLWSQANRKLREISPKNGATLDPLSAEDFVQSDYRAIIQLLEESLAQDDMEPLEYLQTQLPNELRVEVERLLSEPIAAYRQKTVPQILQRETQQIMDNPLRTPDEFLRQVLYLRKQRLKRENQDLYFLQQEADPETELLYGQQLLLNRRALDTLERTMHQMAQAQRQPN